MDFPLPLTLVLMMLEEEALRAGAASSASETTQTPRPGRQALPGGIPRSSGVFSVVEQAERAGHADRSAAQASPRVA